MNHRSRPRSLAGLALCEIAAYLERRRCLRHGHAEPLVETWAELCTRCGDVLRLRPAALTIPADLLAEYAWTMRVFVARIREALIAEFPTLGHPRCETPCPGDHDALDGAPCARCGAQV